MLARVSFVLSWKERCLLLHYDITEGVAECVIFTSELKRSSGIARARQDANILCGVESVEHGVDGVIFVMGDLNDWLGVIHRNVVHCGGRCGYIGGRVESI